MIRYQDSLDGIGVEDVEGGFFDGWPNPPSAENHLRILKGSSHVVLALGDDGRVIGFITVISDGVSCAYIPHLEVRRECRGQGIGKELTQRMVAKLRDLYMIDLCCD